MHLGSYFSQSTTNNLLCINGVTSNSGFPFKLNHLFFLFTKKIQSFKEAEKTRTIFFNTTTQFLSYLYICIVYIDLNTRHRPSIFKHTIVKKKVPCKSYLKNCHFWPKMRYFFLEKACVWRWNNIWEVTS